MFICRFVAIILIFATPLTSMAAKPRQSVMPKGIPFSFSLPKTFELQATQSPGVLLWVSQKAACAITLLTGKSKVESYLWSQIYQNQDNLSAYYQKFAKQEGVEPQKITKTKTVTTQDGIKIPVYYSTQTAGQQTAVFWDGLYVSGGNYASLVLQCAKSGLPEKLALSLFSSMKAEKVESLADEVKKLPFHLSVAQPYYISSVLIPSPRAAALSLKQAVDQIHTWPETEVFINYETGPYANISDFIEKSPLAQEMQLKSQKDFTDKNEDREERVYTLKEKDEKNTSLLFLIRNDKGEMIATLAVISTDKLSTYRPLVERMVQSIKFSSEKDTRTAWKHSLEPEGAFSTAP